MAQAFYLSQEPQGGFYTFITKLTGPSGILGCTLNTAAALPCPELASPHCTPLQRLVKGRRAENPYF